MTKTCDHGKKTEDDQIESLPEIENAVENYII